MEDTVFSKIIRRELPAEILYEDDQVIVVLDRFPHIEGQTLVITKQAEPYVFALSEDTYGYLFQVAKKIALALDQAFDTKRTCLIVEGFDVPHVHVKLYPVTDGTLPFGQGEMASDEKLKAVGEKIRPYL